MKIQWSGMGIVAGRGKIQGTVGSRNRSGDYLRVKVTPNNPNTVAQQTARATLTALSQGWRALTQAQRDAWNAAVQAWSRTDIFGEIRNPSGKNLYTRLNANIASVGGATISDPPLPASVPSAAVGTVTIAVGAGTYTVAFTAAGATTTWQLWATAPLSPGVDFVKSEYRQIGTIAGAGPSPYDFSTEYLAKFGAAVAGQKVFVRMVGVSTATGSKGQATSNYVICAA